MDGIAAINEADWQRCTDAGNPLLSYAFFRALEDSQSAVANTGWLARPIQLTDAKGIVRGILPFYIKSHSWGEYVFDHAWADAWQRSGGEYYPKAQVAIPFTPVTGSRLLIDSTQDAATQQEIQLALSHAAIRVSHNLGLSSAHISFATKAEHDHLTTAALPDELAANSAWRACGKLSAWNGRLGNQFHWQNPGYASFADFLAHLTARKRKMIKRERQAVAAAGVSFRHLTGDDLSPQHWDDFYRFYTAVIDRKWGGAYLTRPFFDAIHQQLRDSILLVMAYQGDAAIAAALNFIGRDALYGRNWGSVVRLPFLHFETCYYQAMEFAISHRLATVEAGAQGPHKIQRGYSPTPTYSLHHMCHPQFHASIADFCRREAEAVTADSAALADFAPFKVAD